MSCHLHHIQLGSKNSVYSVCHDLLVSVLWPMLISAVRPVYAHLPWPVFIWSLCSQVLSVTCVHLCYFPWPVFIWSLYSQVLSVTCVHLCYFPWPVFIWLLCSQVLSVTCVHLCYSPWPVFIFHQQPCSFVFVCPVDSIESYVTGVRPCIQTNLCNGKVKSIWPDNLQKWSFV